MNSISHSLTDDSQWNVYKRLELIPDFVLNPRDRSNPLITGVNLFWRPLLTLLMDELVEEQRVEYLDRCWALNELGEGDRSSSSSLKRFWVLIN